MRSSFLRSIARGPAPSGTDRGPGWNLLHTLALHLRPIRVPERAIRFTHTFGLGGISLVLVLMLMGSGILMMFAYEPSPERAYESVVAMQEQILFGRLVRAVHHWSANLVILVALLHMLRVFLTGGFHGPRRLNWVIGLCLLLCILVSNFTGYLLPWDQLSYWAVTICTAMLGYVPGAGGWLQGVIRGGPEIGRATMIGFYTVHTSVVPVLLIGLMAWHFWRVRKARGLVVPRQAGEGPGPGATRVPFVPDLLLREAVVALILVALVVVTSVVFPAPLGAPANPGMSPNPAKAPWYFLGLQEMLFHFHPAFALFVIPLLATAAVLSIPFLLHDSERAGRWFLSARGRRMSAVAGLTAIAVVPAWIVIDERVLRTGSWPTGFPPVVTSGIAPFAVLISFLIVFYVFMKKRFHSSSDEAAQALFVLLLVALGALTATGVWFRGEGMALVWPWSP